jgi:hypothetical protein
MSFIFFSGFVGDFGLAGWMSEGEDAQEDEATGGDDEPVNWVPVATALGAIEAHLIAGRLNNEGIPTRISQEAAGAALGLTVGLGQIRVLVPESLAERALRILEEPATIDDGEWLEDDGEETE